MKIPAFSSAMALKGWSSFVTLSRLSDPIRSNVSPGNPRVPRNPRFKNKGFIKRYNSEYVFQFKSQTSNSTLHAMIPFTHCQDVPFTSRRTVIYFDHAVPCQGGIGSSLQAREHLRARFYPRDPSQFKACLHIRTFPSQHHGSPKDSACRIPFPPYQLAGIEYPESRIHRRSGCLPRILCNQR